MYSITELDTIAAPSVLCGNNRGRIFFYIAYHVADNAFTRAGKTWLNQLYLRHCIDLSKDHLLEFTVKTETEFKLAWGQIHRLAMQKHIAVSEGHLLTHASKDEEESTQDGLEFKPGANDDGTLTYNDILALPKLPWLSKSALILSGCNTGLVGKRGWSPVKAFCQAQKVKTLGQNGYSYFSKQWDRYEVSSPSDISIYLWSYQRASNGLMGSGDRVPGIIERPAP